MQEMLGEAFAQSVLPMLEGREEQTLERDSTVARLAKSIAGDASSRDRVESFLDRMFEDLRDGAEFDHTEVVMGILVALRAARAPYFDDIASVMARSRAPEVARLRRMAARLIAR